MHDPYFKESLLPGSGAYADDNIGGVSTTGHGESIAKVCLAKHIISLMDTGIDFHTITKVCLAKGIYFLAGVGDFCNVQPSPHVNPR